MDKLPPSIRCKMMQDAGYHYPEPWPAYLLLVDFVKDLARERPDRDNTMEWINDEAQELLKRIGE
jgi:hypothetical protein